MRYKPNHDKPVSSGASAFDKGLIPWQPSTWPQVPSAYNQEFDTVLKEIFTESLILEIQNVIDDAPSLEHRGHVVALSILCAIDTLSSYAFRDLNRNRCPACGRTDSVGPRYQKYIEQFFPREYGVFASRIYKLYRNSITHSWNLFEATMRPGNQPIQELNGTVAVGLLHFFDSLKTSVSNFFERLSSDPELQAAALSRYRELQATAKK